MLLLNNFYCLIIYNLKNFFYFFYFMSSDFAIESLKQTSLNASLTKKLDHNNNIFPNSKDISTSSLTETISSNELNHSSDFDSGI